jgi:hypothetical protein
VGEHPLMGQKVVSRGAQPNLIGTVAAVGFPAIYLVSCMAPDNAPDTDQWADKYPDWHKRELCLVWTTASPTERRESAEHLGLSFDEFPLETMRTGFWLPIDDLEPWDEVEL